MTGQKLGFHHGMFDHVVTLLCSPWIYKKTDNSSFGGA
jgi:hypothetical protein